MAHKSGWYIIRMLNFYSSCLTARTKTYYTWASIIVCFKFSRFFKQLKVLILFLMPSNALWKFQHIGKEAIHYIHFFYHFWRTIIFQPHVLLRLVPLPSFSLVNPLWCLYSSRYRSPLRHDRFMTDQPTILHPFTCPPSLLISGSANDDLIMLGSMPWRSVPDQCVPEHVFLNMASLDDTSFGRNVPCTANLGHIRTE